MGWGSSACLLMAVEADARSTSPAASRTDMGVGGNCWLAAHSLFTFLSLSLHIDR